MELPEGIDRQADKCNREYNILIWNEKGPKQNEGIVIYYQSFVHWSGKTTKLGTFYHYEQCQDYIFLSLFDYKKSGLLLSFPVI